MARNRGKKALYEVMSKAKVKPGAGKIVEPLHPKKAEEQLRQNRNEQPVVEKPQAATQWWTKPRMMQLHAGRIEFSLSYQIAIAIVLGLIALALIIFRLGQYSYRAQRQAAGPAGRTTNNAGINPTRQGNTNRTPAANAASASGCAPSERSPVDPSIQASPSNSVTTRPNAAPTWIR